MVYELDELAMSYREGRVVRLLWDRMRNEVILVFRDHRSDDGFVTTVPNDRALDAYRHPHAYAPSELHTDATAGEHEPTPGSRVFAGER